MRGHDVLIVAPSHTGKFYEKKKGRVHEMYLPSVALPSYDDYRIVLPHSGKVLKHLKSFSPDLVHVHTPFGVGWLGIRYGKRLKVPIVGTYHTLIPEFMMYLPIPVLNKSEFAKKSAWGYTNYFYNNCGVVTTPTNAMAKELEKNGVNSKVVALSNAIDFKLFNSGRKKTYPKKPTKLLYFGRIGFEKNIEVLIFALKHLLWSNKKASLTITGSGPALNYLKEIVATEKLGKHVKFHKPLSHKALPKHIASHDVFVTASTIETQGLTILEAMACGVPCVGANYLAIPDSIKEGKNGFLFKPFDFLDCAKKTGKLISSQTLMKKTGKSAIETARAFSLEKITTLFEKLYSSVSK